MRPFGFLGKITAAADAASARTGWERLTYFSGDLLRA